MKDAYFLYVILHASIVGVKQLVLVSVHTYVYVCTKT